MRARTVVALAVALGAAAGAAAGAPPVQPVRAELVADVAAVGTGQPFRLGVLLRIDPGWHIYGRHSGAAGLPTEVSWVQPAAGAAVEIGALGWPVPARYAESAGAVGYGYSDEALLIAPARAPAAAAAGDSLRIGARVSWLACREQCLPGEAELALALPVGTRAAPSAAVGLFARHQTRLPVPLPAAAGLTVATLPAAAGEAPRLRLALAGAAPAADGLPDFVPDDPQCAVRVAVDRQRPPALIVEVEGAGAAAGDTLHGVLLYRMPGDTGVRGGTVALPLGDAAAAGQGAAPPVVLGLQGEAARQRPAWRYVLFAFAGGLLLNLMPCVLPVISLKVLDFVGHAGAGPRRARLLGLLFAAGVLAAFAALAVAVILLQAAGEQVGWGFQFQHPGFVMAMAAVIFALALSLFELFAIDLGLAGPGPAARREGPLGSFANGVLATVLATPCTAPFLGTALGFAFTQPPATVLGIFLAIGAGMALPYLALALRPAWRRWLPRPGPWLGRFRQGMGFVLLGTVVWLLWVVGKQLGAEGVTRTVGFLLVAAVALWIPGQWVDLRSARRRRRLAWLAAVLLIAGGARFLLHPVLQAEYTLAAAPARRGDPLPWEPFARARVEELLRAAQRPVLLVFTADWCWTCKVNERTVLADERVGARLQELDVALVRADWTRRDPEITALLAAFGRAGVPLYVLYAPGAPAAPLVLPELLTVGTMLRFLDQVAPRAPAANGSAPA